jgi:type VI secretion system protein VasI
VDISPLTDDKNVYLSLSSENELPGQFGDSGKADLLLRCRENTTSVVIVMNDQFMASIQGYGKVEYRLDENPMKSVSMKESTDNKALGLWNGGQAIPFITTLLASEKLVLRATPFNQSAMTATFDLRGISNAIQELRETCNW